MSWGIQVLDDKDIHDPKWNWLHPTGGAKYEYPTKDEADNMMRICYPDQVREHRLGGKQVVRVKTMEH